MKLSHWIKTESVLLDIEAKDKWDVLDRLIQQLVETDQIPRDQHALVRQAIIAREKSMSTGMEQGIAIPHAAVDGIPDLVVALGILPQGIPFESIDGEAASIVILLVIPKSKKLTHIRTLAEVARLLSREGLRKRMLEAQDAEGVLDAIRQEEEQGVRR